MESTNCPFSSILSSLGPRSEATDRRPHLCILGVSSASSYVCFFISPSLCRKESLIPNSDITHRMYALHSPRELQTGKTDRPGSLWNGVSGVVMLIPIQHSVYNNSIVAIKECTPNQRVSRKRILMELDVMSRLKHDAIIRNYGYNIHKDPEDPSKEIIAFIMEKADGDLEHKIGSLQSDGVPREDRNKVPLKYRKTYILQIAIGLMYMNKMGVYHADLKIDNILMVNGNCKIADFGLSKIMENSLHISSSSPVEADLTVSRIGDIGNILQ